MIYQRDAFGRALVAAGRTFPSLFVLDADNATATRVSAFAARYPSRFMNVGVAEQNLVGVAAGLALCGYKALACTFAIFLCGRAFEVLRNCVALNDLPVVLVGTHAGVSVGRDGATHFAIEDVALMRCLPNMHVVVPADARQILTLLPQVLNRDGPTYFRVSRWGTPNVTPKSLPIVLGKGCMIADGDDCCIIATGIMVYMALQARKLLKRREIRCAVAAIHTIKPLDEPFVLTLAERYGALVVAEEHNTLGGMYSAIAELLVAQCPVRCASVGIPDTFAKGGPEERVLAFCGLTAVAIAEAVRGIL